MMNKPLTYLLPLLIFLATSCDSPKGGSGSAENQVLQTNTSITADSVYEDSIAEVIYYSATVYAGSTDYAFEDTVAGELVMIRWSYMDSGSFKIPDNMLEDPDTLEGIPAENPGMVGRVFQLVYGQNGLKEIRLK